MRYINVHSRNKERSKTHLQLTRTNTALTFSPRTRTLFIDPCARGLSVHGCFSPTLYLSPCPPVYSLAENWSTASVIFAKESLMRYACMIFPRQTCYYSPQSNVNQKKMTLVSLSLYRSHNRDTCRFFFKTALLVGLLYTMYETAYCSNFSILSSSSSSLLFR